MRVVRLLFVVSGPLEVLDDARERGSEMEEAGVGDPLPGVDLSRTPLKGVPISSFSEEQNDK